MPSLASFSRATLAGLFTGLGLLTSLADARSVRSTILVIARDAASAENGYSGLRGYGIPYEVLTVPQGGVTLPTLSDGEDGNYGGIVVISEVSYEYDNGWHSAITTEQWDDIYTYQTDFGVRMVRLDVYPNVEFATETSIPGAGCCDSGVEQLVSISDDSAFSTAGMKTGAGVSTSGLWHYPASITNTTAATEIAKFDPAGDFNSETTAAVINHFDGGREQMVWFMGWATVWSPTSNYLQHSYIHWMTRGLYAGFRRIYFGTQVDDVFLSTEMYRPQGVEFRLRPGDLDAHVIWMADINGRLPAGSDYYMELGHNGNGDIEESVEEDDADGGSQVCQPDEAIEYPEQPDTPLEYQKPLGSGTDVWPATPTEYAWSLSCAEKDELEQWFEDASNKNAFAHVSHTFTHLELNNATYSDAAKEIQFNQAWAAQVGIASANKWSPNGIIPPAITGLHNGDAIRAWMDNGIYHVVGDNTRPPLMNSNNPHWPLISTVADNGYAGLTIVPRWATTIYYNCDLPDCTLQEWIDTSGGSGDYQNLLLDAKNTNTRHLFSLKHDPFMFHQANLRQTDVDEVEVNGEMRKLSMIQTWVEVVLQEMVRLTDWPIVTLKHDDIAAAFINRMGRDQCEPGMTYTLSNDGTSITGVTVTANGNSCDEAIPVTFPGPVTSNNGGTPEQIGNDPLTIWVTLSGSPVSFTLSTPVSLS
ncbi:hypothetical protein BDY21DRAFT_363118 [Lineolata rhizophorae]|uniref:Extracellular serine-rich protein n=1 Tax=Lineolata rhizophorae TaxID=578093 RepID=A0A6A6P2Z5_9PEZI|nr:hypothetical protein BDY21DRAFT_363118 [Lineolata rhizophorae]